MSQTRRFDHRRHEAALEILRQEGSLLTMAEALAEVDRRRGVAEALRARVAALRARHTMTPEEAQALGRERRETQRRETR